MRIRNILSKQDKSRIYKNIKEQTQYRGGKAKSYSMDFLFV